MPPHENREPTLPYFTAEETTDSHPKLKDRGGEEADKISGNAAAAERLGGLPLELTQMAGVMDQRELSLWIPLDS